VGLIESRFGDSIAAFYVESIKEPPKNHLSDAILDVES